MQRPDWSGRTVVCIASGPSLTEADCETVRATGHPTIITNSTFELCPWAEVLFGLDSKWWRANPLAMAFKGRKISASSAAGNLGVETTYCSGWFRSFGNSGACAISLALAAQASKVVLLGFDCALAPDGRKHWHEDHRGQSNCDKIAEWPRQFALVAVDARRLDVPVLNASRRTALKCFERRDLEEAL